MHLDLLRLDAVRAGEGTPQELDHVRSCAECRGEVEQFSALAARMKNLPGAIPASVERSILRRPRILRRCVSAAAAALIVIGVFALARPADPHDVNRDGTVDIIDAYQLALKRADPRDIEAIVRRCVKVAK
jgi:hypothetical protein